MARKVFISVLGTGLYNECTYADGDNKQPPTRFVQVAMLQAVGASHWGADDMVLIALTDGARKANWEVENNKRARRNRDTCKDEYVTYVGLKQELDKLNLPCQVVEAAIPDGKNEDEIWEIFNVLFDKLNEGDELYIDLTHAFRYLPMLVLVLINYAKFLKHVTVARMTYGNYEAFLKKETDVAPIVDLLPIVSLQEWTSAAADYLQNGYAEKLEKLSLQELRPILARTQGQDPDAVNLKNFVKAVRTFTEEMQACRGINITKGESATRAMRYVNQIDRTVITPLQPVLKEIKSKIEPFTSQTTNCLEAADWCFKNLQYQQAVTLLKEWITSFVGAQFGIDFGDRDGREVVDKALAYCFDKNQKFTDKDAAEYAEKHPVFTTIIDSELLKNDILKKLYSGVPEIRNDFNHAGFRPNPCNVNRIKTRIKNYLDQARQLVKSVSTPVAERQALPKLFINLTNHPSGEWSEEQLAAARQLGDVEDMEFPDIAPHADEVELDQLAAEYARRIVSRAAGHETTVHVMGEMTFTHRLVTLLQDAGVRCVASTTVRDVSTDIVGNKVVAFHFSRFRDY